MAMTHPRLGAVAETLSLLKLLADPKGIKAIVDEIEPLRKAAEDAFARLGEAQQAHTDRAAELDAQAATLSAQKADIEKRAGQLGREVAAHANNVGALADRQAEVAKLYEAVRVRELKVKEDESVAVNRAAEVQKRETVVARLQVEAEAALARAKAREEAAEQFALAETARLKAMGERIVSAARSVGEVA